MPRSFPAASRAVAWFALLPLASLAACAAPASAPESTDAVSEGAAVAGATYVRLETASDGAYTLSRVNGGKLVCADGSRAWACAVERLELPADCDWECKDGVLSLQGVTVLRGDFALRDDAASGRRVPAFVAAAAFDTFDASLGKKTVYRVTSRKGACHGTTCATDLAATVLGGRTPRDLVRVDFSEAHDPNYVLDPSRGIAQMARPEGLLVSGSISRGVFHADRVWRQWAPAADCDVLAAARAYYFTTPPAPGEVNLEFATTAEAEAYVDPSGSTVKWLVRTDKTADALGFTGGVNDLWAQTFTVDTRTCAVTLTGEH